MIGTILVLIAAFIGLIYGIGGFDDLIQRHNKAINQPWRKKKDHSE